MSPSDPTVAPVSGRQHVIGHGHQQVVVAAVGATLRSYTVGDEAVVDGFDAEEVCPGGRGQVLAPWPGRLGDGRYSFEGRNARVPLDEPERRNAIHGLVRWLAFEPVSTAQNVLALAATLEPQPAYPWRLSLTVEYRLGRDGLTVSAAARHDGDGPAPFGIGFHPYLTVGTPSVDTVGLTVPGRRRLVCDDRMLPTGEAPVAGTEFDFTTRRPVGPTRLDTCYRELRRDADGRVRVELDHPDGERGVTLWADGAFGYLTVFSADTVEPAARRRASLAVEPMTCPPDAMRSGTDLVRLERGVGWRGTWGISPRFALFSGDASG